MKADDLALLITELRNGGPSPFVPEMDQPTPVIFYNEMEMLAGESSCTAFGKQSLVSVITTSFRLILYQKNKRGTDQCRSYWHKVDFEEWRWEEPDGFVIASIETSKPEFGIYETDEKLGPTASWSTYVVNPEGERKLLEEVIIHLTRYHYHQEQRFAPWDEFISPGGTVIDGKERNPAATWFGAKIDISTRVPGVINLEALWELMDDPMGASGKEVGFIPEDSAMHPSKATKERTSVGIKKITKGRTGRKPRGKQVRKALKTAISTGSQVKGAVETAKKVASVIESTSSATSQVGGAVESIERVSKGMQVASNLASAGICVGCGAPRNPGAVFCGKCGQRLADAIVEEVKDQIKGKAEDAVVEKVEEILEPEDEDQPEEAKGVAKKAETELKDSPTESSDDDFKLETETETMEEKRSKAKTKSSKNNCSSCGRRIQPSWKFCPDCSHTLTLVCKDCGSDVEAGWKFCPRCTSKL